MNTTQYQLPEPFVPPRGPDWHRVAKWCFVGSLAMLLWLLYPTVTCSWQKFRDQPNLTSFDDHELQVWRADKERIDRAETFGERWWASCETCYEHTPVFGQSEWKSNVLVLLLLGWIVAKFGSIQYRRRRRTVLS